jgi:hypothetical protein
VVPAPAAGTASGGGFTITGGLWNAVRLTAGSLVLTVAAAQDGQVTISWTPEATGYQLQTTTVLGSEAIWSPVSPAPIGPSFTTLASGRAQFFRLRKP